MQMLSLGMRRCVTLEDGDCYIIGIANGFQMNQESMTPRGENDKETIKTEDRVYPLRYDEW